MPRLRTEVIMTQRYVQRLVSSTIYVSLETTRSEQSARLIENVTTVCMPPDTAFSAFRCFQEE